MRSQTIPFKNHDEKNRHYIIAIVTFESASLLSSAAWTLRWEVMAPSVVRICLVVRTPPSCTVGTPRSPAAIFE